MNRKHNDQMIFLCPGEDKAEQLGFTYLKFDGKIDVHFHDREIYLYYVRSINPQEGNVRQLLEDWILEGWDVRVVMPNIIMQELLGSLGFVDGIEKLPRMYPNNGRVEVWSRPHDWGHLQDRHVEIGGIPYPPYPPPGTWIRSLTL